MTNLSGIPRDSLIGKLLRAPLRLIPRRAVVPILQGPLRGMRWTVGSATHGCWLGSYEYNKQKALQRILKLGDVVYDIGANVGFYSLFSSVLVGETGHVYAFEPFLDNLYELRRHFVLNDVKNSTVIEAAVSSTDGEGLFDPTTNRCTGHLNANGTYHVHMVTLDRLFINRQIRSPNLMKIDIEGAEYECLQGATTVISRSRPVIFLSTHGRELHISCSNLLRGWNYQLESLDGRPPAESDELIAIPAET